MTTTIRLIMAGLLVVGGVMNLLSRDTPVDSILRSSCICFGASVLLLGVGREEGGEDDD